jgi:uncharacterized protein (DUF1501 family)
MALTRRELLRRGAMMAPAVYLAPKVFLRTVYGAPAAGPRNLILVELFGGNDGLNTVVPYGLNGGTYYTEFRKKLAVPESSLLKINAQLGFHPSFASLKAHYDAGRLAVIQGVSYPNPSFSHEKAERIWDTGDPSSGVSSGWLARYLALHPTPSFPSGLEVEHQLDGVLQGSGQLVPALKSVDEFKFPHDSAHAGDAQNRRVAYEAIATGLTAASGPVGTMAKTSNSILDLIDTFDAIPPYTPVGTYPQSSFSKALKLVAQLLKANLGLRFFHLGYGGFDTHSDQNKDDYHKKRLQTVSDGISALYTDLVSLGLASDTIFVVYTEFGRTVYDNGSKGTDHGTVSPVFVLGNPVVGGLVTAHPSMDPSGLTSQDELPMVADYRNVFGTVVSKWLNESAAAIFPGFVTTSLGFLP